MIWSLTYRNRMIKIARPLETLADAGLLLITKGFLM
jgi:hypothetical protein